MATQIIKNYILLFTTTKTIALKIKYKAGASLNSSDFIKNVEIRGAVLPKKPTPREKATDVPLHLKDGGNKLVIYACIGARNNAARAPRIRTPIYVKIPPKGKNLKIMHERGIVIYAAYIIIRWDVYLSANRPNKGMSTTYVMSPMLAHNIISGLPKPDTSDKCDGINPIKLRAKTPDNQPVHIVLIMPDL